MAIVGDREKRKVLFIIPSLVGGGAENSLVKLLKVIDYNRFSITLLVVCYQGVYVNSIPKSVNVKFMFRSDILVRILAYVQKKTGWSLPFKVLFQHKISEKFDSAISFIDGNFTDLLFYLPPNTRLISWVHSSYKTNTNFSRFYQNKKYLRRVIEHRYSKLDTIIFVSNDAKREFIEIMGVYSDMRVVYNIFDEVDIRKKAAMPNPNPRKSTFTFVSVGSLIPVKGYELLIAASGLVKDAGYNFRVEIIGTGFLEQALVNQVQLLGLEKFVFFLGYQENPFVFMKNADVFVMSSLSEALPSVLCEAFILEKPVLVVNAAGCNEVVGNGEYGITADRSPQSLAKQMIRCMEDAEFLKHYQEMAIKRSKYFNMSNSLQLHYSVLDGN